MTSDPIRYERRFWLLAEALKLAPLGEALQLAKSAEAWLISDEHQAEFGTTADEPVERSQPLSELSRGSSYLRRSRDGEPLPFCFGRTKASGSVQRVEGSAAHAVPCLKGARRSRGLAAWFFILPFSRANHTRQTPPLWLYYSATEKNGAPSWI